MSVLHRAKRLTLRARLTLLLVSMVLLACAIVGVVTGVVISRFLNSRLDHDLELAGSRYAISLEHNDHDDDNDPETATVGQAVGTLGARLLGGKLTAVGVIAAGRTPVPVSGAARQAIIDVAATGVTTATVDLPGLGTYRVLVARGNDGDELITGLPQEQVEDTLEVVAWTEIVVFLLVAVMVGVLGGLAVRRSLRPLRRVASTALRISELPLAAGEVALAERVRGADLPTEVGQVASAVNLMLAHVETALSQRQESENRLRQFVADASHELRTPLAIVRSHTELLELETNHVSAGVRAALRSIDSGTRRMARLVDDLLLLARLDSGAPLEHAPVDLTLLVLEAVSDARTLAAAHRWSLDLPETPVMVDGDHDRLAQVVVNVLTNARVHTPAGTGVSVQLSAGAFVRLEIVDDGPGIPPELLPRVFERFASGKHSSATGGSGLGLSIVAGVVHAHGGELAVDSRPGRTSVRISLPPATDRLFTGAPVQPFPNRPGRDPRSPASNKA